MSDKASDYVIHCSPSFASFDHRNPHDMVEELM